MRDSTPEEIASFHAMDEVQLKMLESSVYQRLKPRGTNLTPKKKKRKRKNT